MSLPAITIEEDKEVTNTNIHDWRLRVSIRGWTGYHRTWPPKKGLFGRSYNEIMEFLMARRENAVDPSEYYDTLPYLSTDVDLKVLDLTFTNYQVRKDLIGISGLKKFSVIQKKGQAKKNPVIINQHKHTR